MSRGVTKGIRPMHWLVPKTPFWDLEIDDVSKKTEIWSAECTRALCPEIGSFKIVLDNNNGAYSEVYSGEEKVEFLMDRTDGTTLKFKGEVDSVFAPNDSSKGFTISLSGNHISGELLTISVTCLLYTSDAADDLLCVDLGGRRIIFRYFRRLEYKILNRLYNELHRK